MAAQSALVQGTTWKIRLSPLARSMNVLSDEQLARNVQRGHTADLTELVERHHSALLGFLYRLTGGDRALAEDLTQEAFLRALRSIRQYRPAQRFKPWLYAIAVNAARDHFKRAETRYATVLSDEDLLGLAAPFEVDDTFVDAGQQIAVALSALPIHQREAIILRYYQDLSLAEMADMLAIPVGTVKSRLSLGLRQLRLWLKEDEAR